MTLRLVPPRRSSTPELLGGPLLEAHRAHLHTSGLTDDTISAAGIVSMDEAVTRAAGFAEGLNGIGFPYPGTAIVVDGRTVPYYRLRVDAERVRSEGQKYENPLAHRLDDGLTYSIYMPPGVEALRKDATRPVVLTEGEKKALALTQEGFPALGLPGVFMFSDPRSEKAPADKPLHPELRRWRWRDRRVLVCFDSDRVERDAVALAPDRSGQWYRPLLTKTGPPLGEGSVASQPRQGQVRFAHRLRRPLTRPSPRQYPPGVGGPSGPGERVLVGARQHPVVPFSVSSGGTFLVSGAALAHERLCRKLTEAGADAWVVTVPGQRGGPKLGADDFLVAHGRAAFQGLVDAAVPWTPFGYLLDLLPPDLRLEVMPVVLEPLARNLADASRTERQQLAEAVAGRFPTLDRADVARLLGLGEGPGSDNRPEVQVNDRQVVDIVDDAWDALRASKVGRQLFRRGRALVYVPDGKDHVADPATDLHPVDAPLLGALLNRAASWVTIKGEETRDSRLPPEVVRDMLALPDPGLPPLDVVVRAPTILHDGTLAVRGGYYPQDRLYHVPDPALLAALPEVPDAPTEEQRFEALAFLLTELLADFPFATDADAAHALAALLLPFVRRLIPGPTPLHLVEAPSEGTGKGLLADIVHRVAIGRPMQPTTLPKGEEEVRKKLTALLQAAPPVIVLDNLGHAVDSASIAAVLTADEWSDRLLGQTQMVTVPNRAVWFATGNNPVLSRENARRTVRIRLDADHERPWLRTEFRHPDLRGWVRENRPRIVHAVLVLVRAWVAAGMPRGEVRLGSFEPWSEVVGGILGHAGVHAFLAGREDFQEVAAPEEAEWATLVDAWWAEHRDAPVEARRVMELAIRHGLFDLAGQSATDPAARTRFSRALARRRDRRFGAYRIGQARDGHRKQALYRLECRAPAAEPATAHAPEATAAPL